MLVFFFFFLGWVFCCQPCQQDAYGHPPPIDPAKQLIQQSYHSALSQLHSSHCSRLMSYRHFVGWADNSTCPDCRSTDTQWPISLAVLLISRTWSWGICGLHPSRLLNFWQGFHSLASWPHFRSTLTPFLHNIHSCCWPSPPWPPAVQYHLHLPFTPLHLTSAPGVISPLHSPTTTTVIINHDMV